MALAHETHDCRPPRGLHEYRFDFLHRDRDILIPMSGLPH